MDNETLDIIENLELTVKLRDARITELESGIKAALHSSDALYPKDCSRVLRSLLPEID